MRIDAIKFHSDEKIGKLNIVWENLGNESFVSATYEQQVDVDREYVSELKGIVMKFTSILISDDRSCFQ